MRNTDHAPYLSTFTHPWRVEGRATKLHPWVPMGLPHKTLNGAIHYSNTLRGIADTRVRAR